MSLRVRRRRTKMMRKKIAEVREVRVEVGRQEERKRHLFRETSVET